MYSVVDEWKLSRTIKAIVLHPRGSALATSRGCKCYINNRIKVILTSRDSVGDAAKNPYHSNLRTGSSTPSLPSVANLTTLRLSAIRKCWPFKIVKKNDKPAIEVQYKGEKRQCVSTWMCWLLAQTPEEVSAMVLGRMKETAEAYLGKTVTHAVVAAPACTLLASSYL